MALRRAVTIPNQENVDSRMLAKSNIQPIDPIRKALGELGNRPQLPQKTQDKGITIVPVKKEPTKPGIVGPAQKKKNLIRQESLLKNIIVDPVVTKKVDESSSKLTPLVAPDENVKNDPQMAPEYLEDIFNHLREMEIVLGIDEKFLTCHMSTPRMRAILVNWLVDVHLNFKCALETLFLCITLVDRYLHNNKQIGRSTLQLVGTSAMLLSCKYEEIYAPDLDDFEFICDNTFSRRQILQMEMDILKKLDFTIGNPLPIHFLRRYAKIAQISNEQYTLAKYILELALLEHELCHIRPSIQAAAACCLSMGILGEVTDIKKLWSSALVYCSKYTYNDIRFLISEFAMLIVKSEKSKYQSSRTKYAASKFGKISLNPKLNGPLVRNLTIGKK